MFSSIAYPQCVRSSPQIQSVTGAVTIGQSGGDFRSPGVAWAGSMLAVGDRLATADNSTAEVRVDQHVLQLGPNTELRLMPKQENCIGTLALDKGSLTYRVLDGPPSLLDLSTPSLTVGPATTGLYRISVTTSGQSEIAVKEGIVFVGGFRAISDGQKLLARGPADNPEIKIGSTTPKWLRLLSSVALLSLRAGADVAAALPSGGSGPAPSRSTGGSNTIHQPAAHPPSPPTPAGPPRLPPSAPPPSSGNTRSQ